MTSPSSSATKAGCPIQACCWLEWATTCVIPSAAEGSAVPRTFPGNVFLQILLCSAASRVLAADASNDIVISYEKSDCSCSDDLGHVGRFVCLFSGKDDEGT